MLVGSVTLCVICVRSSVCVLEYKASLSLSLVALLLWERLANFERGKVNVAVVDDPLRI
jgi:hypothetical protein